MRLLSRYAFIAAILYPFSFGALGALPDTIEKIKASVVGVGTVFPVNRLKVSDASPAFLGTGFVVGNGRQVVTNYHVVQKPLDDEKHERLVVFAGEGKAARVYMAKIVRTDSVHDLALLEFSGPKLPAMALNVSRQLREGENIAFTGFPIGLVLGLQPVTHQGMVSAITPYVMPAFSSKLLTAEKIKRARQPFNVYQLDATAYPGNSGSPVYDMETGEVLAVINSVFVKESKEAMLTNPSDISYAIPVSYVKELVSGVEAEHSQ